MAFQYWVNERYVRYVTDRQTDKNETYPMVKYPTIYVELADE